MKTSAHFINFNATILPSVTPLLTADNRGFRYGDGIFETMAVKNGRIRLGGYHFERLATGARLLQFEIPFSLIPGQLTHQIQELCERNGHSLSARVRLVLFRKDMGLPDAEDPLPDYIIQSWPLAPGDDELNTKGWSLGIFPDGRKACDPLSNLKSNNYLLYVLAASYARKQGSDDCLVLNSQGRIADSTIANLFYIRQNKIYTPPLSEGCVAGVMRRRLLELLPSAGFECSERPVTIEDLACADEVFLTNALKGIRWIASFRHRTYTHELTTSIYRELRKVL
ncbi:MAG TPA: aminotransferase class IV [Puia sp.]